MFRLQVKEHIDSAHFIGDYIGKCSRVHGHRWDIEIVLEGERLDSRNILIDFADVKRMLEFPMDKLDHQILNNVLDERNVTAEYLAKWFFDNLENCFSHRDARLVRVTVWESPECCVKYYGSSKEKST